MYPLAIGKHFRLGRDLNQRDTIAVKRTVPGLLKLLHPHEDYDKEAVRYCLEYALESRRRIKEQLKRIGGMEFFDVHFSYIDLETNEEKFIMIKEQGGGSLIPEGPLSPGSFYTVARGSGGHLGIYCLETQITGGSGQLKLSSFVALCSGLLGKAVEPQLVVLGTMSLGGNIVPVENLAESLQVAADAGAKRLLLPMASVADISTIPGELFATFQTGFYADLRDAVFKALGVN